MHRTMKDILKATATEHLSWLICSLYSCYVRERGQTVTAAVSVHSRWFLGLSSTFQLRTHKKWM